MTPDERGPSRDFIREIIEEDVAAGKHGGQVVTRFPPEPNGYLHIGHAKSICLNFGVAAQYSGRCHLRFDDTNPVKEDVEYMDAIQEDVRWLGFDWGANLFHASDYFDRLYELATELIRRGKAYVCDLTTDEIREHRGTLTEPGRDSPYRNRSVRENLALFERMRRGEFPDGSRVLRARIDMTSPNITMRDPTLYRIRRVAHPRTQDRWCLYPMYDFTHCISDSLEGITHSLCTLEFENNRPLYDWVLNSLDLECHPQQIEFARLNLTHTVMSKRKLLELVTEKHVSGWDDPRMPTLVAMRRRGYTPEAIRAFCDRIGLARKESWIDLSVLEDCLREDLNARARRVMGVLRPLKLVLTNYPTDLTEAFEIPYFPDDPPRMGSRQVPFSREIYIERDDFMEDPPKKFFRLSPGAEVRLRRAYIIRCEKVVKDDATSEILELHGTYDPQSRGGDAADGRKLRGTIHWVSARHALPARVRLYDRLFTALRPGMDKKIDYRETLNPMALQTLEDARLEPGLATAGTADRFQFERQGYFSLDPLDSSEGRPVFNRIVPLRESWSKVVQKA